MCGVIHKVSFSLQSNCHLFCSELTINITFEVSCFCLHYNRYSGEIVSLKKEDEKKEQHISEQATKRLKWMTIEDYRLRKSVHTKKIEFCVSYWMFSNPFLRLLFLERVLLGRSNVLSLFKSLFFSTVPLNVIFLYLSEISE